MSKRPLPEDENDRLDIIIDILDQANRRAKWAAFGGFIRSLIMMAPAILVIWFAWNVIRNPEAYFDKIAQSAAKYASQQVNQNFVVDEGVLDQVKGLLEPLQGGN